MYYNIGRLYYLGGICLLYEGLLPKPRSVYIGYFISIFYLSKAKVRLFVYCILYIKRKWRPLRTNGRARSLFIYGYSIILIKYILTTNDKITLVDALYRTVKLTRRTNRVRRTTTIILNGAWKPVQPEVVAGIFKCCPLQAVLWTILSCFEVYIVR